MEEIKQHCEKVILMLRLDYPAQLQYPGSIKKIYDVMLQILSCDEHPDVDWVGMVRCLTMKLRIIKIRSSLRSIKLRSCQRKNNEAVEKNRMAKRISH